MLAAGLPPIPQLPKPMEPLLKLPNQLRVVGAGEPGGEFRAWSPESDVELGLLKFGWFRVTAAAAATYGTSEWWYATISKFVGCGVCRNEVMRHPW